MPSSSSFSNGEYGAAIATILSQLMALMWQFKLFSNKSELLHFKKGIYRLKRKLVDNILAIDISPFLMNVCACIIVIFINNQRWRMGGDLSPRVPTNSNGICNGVRDVRIRRKPRNAAYSRIQLRSPETGPTDSRTEPEHHCRHRHHGNGLADSDVPALLCARLFTTDKQLIDWGIKAIRVVMFDFSRSLGSRWLSPNSLPVHRKGRSVSSSPCREQFILLPLLAFLPMILGH